MGQVEVATSTGGKKYIITQAVINEDADVVLGENCSIGNNLTLGNTLNMPLYIPQDILDLLRYMGKGQVGIRFGVNNDPTRGFITCVDVQKILSGTDNVPENEEIRMRIRANNEIEISTAKLILKATELWIYDSAVGTDKQGLTTTQTFKDGGGATKTMTITNGIITGIS